MPFTARRLLTVVVDAVSRIDRKFENSNMLTVEGRGACGMKLVTNDRL